MTNKPTFDDIKLENLSAERIEDILGICMLLEQNEIPQGAIKLRELISAFNELRLVRLKNKKKQPLTKPK